MADDDPAYVRARVPDYADYADEASRHHTDLVLRTFVGEHLNDARQRVGDELDERTSKTLDELILHCQFTDQAFIHWLDHARLDPPLVASLVAIDRRLVELAERVKDANASDLHDLLEAIDIAFEHRREPLPA
ncbi:MAG TPA: hypothetical protein VKG44_01015 [Candidatus Baltobacteraceae bacterium]|nr:hypothetical protein [Candidatus Baltobacteraceae bacterium]